MKQGTLIGQEEAVSLIATIEDPIVKRLVRTQMGVAIALSLGGTRPTGQFDLVFFVKCAIDFAHKQQLIRTILDGEKPEGFPE